MKLLLPLILLAMACAGFNTPLSANPYPPEIERWTEAQKAAQREAGQQLLARVEEARQLGQTEVRIPRADYRFSKAGGASYNPSHLFLADLRGVTLDFQGSTLWFETAATGIFLKGCKGVTVKNAVLDWDPLPFTQGVIESVDGSGNALVVRLDPAYERVLPGMQGDASWRGAAFERGTRRFKERQVGWYVDFSWKARQADGSYRFPFRGFWGVKAGESGLAAGDPVAFWDRRGYGVSSEGNENCTLEKIVLYSCPFIGFAENTGVGGTRYLGCKIVPRPGTDRLMGGNADGFNVACVKRGPVIDSCEIDTLGDDFVNVHHSFSRVLWQEESGALVISPICFQNKIPGKVTLEFFDRRSMKRLGERKAAVEDIPSWELREGRCLADLSVHWLAGEASGLAYGKSVHAQRLVFDSPLAIQGDAIASCREFSSPGAVIRNNHFRGSLARGLRLQSPQIVVENNVIEDVCDEAITLSSQPGRWGEGPYVKDAVIKGNTIRRTGAATREHLLASEPGIFSAAIFIEVEDAEDPSCIQGDISIVNNTLSDIRGGIALFARNVDGLRITGNLVSGYLERPFAGLRGTPEDDPRLCHAFVLDHVKGLVQSGNRFEFPGRQACGAIYTLNPPPKQN